MIEPFYSSFNKDFIIAHGDSFQLLKEFDFKFNMIFADPPYFLSNGGISLQSGRVVCVNKGEWDKGKSPEEMNEFNMEWLKLCRDKLKDNGTIITDNMYFHGLVFKDKSEIESRNLKQLVRKLNNYLLYDD